MKLLLTGRPTEIAEHDVYICESKYHENEKNVRKLAKGLKVSSTQMMFLTVQIQFESEIIVNRA